MVIRFKFEVEPRLLAALEAIAAYLMDQSKTQQKIDQLAQQLGASNKLLKNTLKENK